jgi:hypothetical protein
MENELKPKILILSNKPYLIDLLTQYGKYNLINISTTKELEAHFSKPSNQLIIIDYSEDFKNFNLEYISQAIILINDYQINNKDFITMNKPLILNNLKNNIDLILNRILDKNIINLNEIFDLNIENKILSNKFNNTQFYLTDKEFNIIRRLYNNNHVTKKELLKEIWNYNESLDTHTLETHIYRLRQKTGTNFELIISKDEGYCINNISNT